MIKYFRIILFGLVFLVSISVNRATTYTSNRDGAWNVASTWTPNGIPDVNNWPNDKVIIDHAITYSGNLVLKGGSSSITINGSGSLEVSVDFDCASGYFTMAVGSVLTVGRDVLIQPTSGKVINGTISSGRDMELDGNLTGSPTLVIGRDLLLGAGGGTMNFTNIDIDVTRNMTVQNINLSWDSGDIAVGKDFLQKGSSNTSIPLGGTLTVDRNLAINNITTIDGFGNVEWGGNISGSGNNKVLNGCDKNSSGEIYTSPIDLSTCAAPLPVTFANLNSDCSDDGVLVSWNTSLEKNNSHFVVEKSYDLRDFVAIGQVEGAGNSSSILSYTYINDDISDNVTNYYRVKQVDYNGDSDYSKVVFSTCLSQRKIFSIYPTVSDGNFTIQFISPVSQLTIEVYNSLGEKVYSKQAQEQFDLTYKFDLYSLVPGVYLIKLKIDGVLQLSKVIIQ